MGAEINKETGKISINSDGLYKMNFQDLLSYVAQNHDYILVADIHTEPGILQTFIAPETITRMKELGITDICLEQAKEHQILIDGYYAGTISFEELQAVYGEAETPWLKGDDLKAMQSRFPQFIKEAKEAGINIHYMDRAATDYPVVKEQPKLFQLFVQLMGMQPNQQAEHIKKLEQEEPGIRQALEKFRDTFWEQRSKNDELIAKDAEEIKKNGGKVAMLYGALHFIGARDINEFLGPKAAVIGMNGTLTQRWEDTQLNIENLPDYLHILKIPTNDGKVISASAKLQPSNDRMETCKAIINGTNTIYALAACSMQDVDLERFADNPILWKNKKDSDIQLVK